MKAIAAMATNRVIGKNGQIPWRLPEDFRWFKRTTLGHVVVMGRKTYESLGRPLPGRENIVLTRSGKIPGVRTICDIGKLPDPGEGREVFVIGGAEIYNRLLPLCDELLLSLVHREVEGDVLFPAFEHLYEKRETLLTFPEFSVLRYVRKSGDSLQDGAPGPPHC